MERDLSALTRCCGATGTPSVYAPRLRAGFRFRDGWKRFLDTLRAVLDSIRAGRHLALIEQGGPVIAVASDPALRDKVVANIEEVRARGAVVLALGAHGDVDLKEHADRVWIVPATPPLLSPVGDIVPLQLFG